MRDPKRNSVARWWSAVFVAGAASGALSCSPPGTRPHEMSVAGHTAAAQREEQAASAAGQPLDPSLAQSFDQCAPGGALPAKGLGPCWTPLRARTSDQVRLAEEHRRLAKMHRAAAQALRDAEATACGEVSEYDRDTSPFSSRQDIALVRPLTGRLAVGKGGPTIERVLGARVTFHDVPGLTVDRLQRIVDCHLARNAALGHAAPEMPDCPLVPEGVRATVERTEAGHVAVDIVADDPKVAEEVWRRASQRPRPASP
jgi:hypothetical protein